MIRLTFSQRTLNYVTTWQNNAFGNSSDFKLLNMKLRQRIYPKKTGTLLKAFKTRKKYLAISL